MLESDKIIDCGAEKSSLLERLQRTKCTNRFLDFLPLYFVRFKLLILEVILFTMWLCLSGCVQVFVFCAVFLSWQVQLQQVFLVEPNHEFGSSSRVRILGVLVLMEFLVLLCRYDNSVTVSCIPSSYSLFMLWRVLERTPCHSDCESPFLSYLQPCSSGITSWKHQTIAHMPVHPSTCMLS
ncbi:hypothetical protein AMECASPLE_036749 [Ameca splendens]|uniref:Uncharacterized protein n=1 Tax=Ameca splendens TaxID=208324 RepID=A0ABV0XWT8_9TELE